jgi:hypothetical protein
MAVLQTAAFPLRHCTLIVELIARYLRRRARTVLLLSLFAILATTNRTEIVVVRPISRPRTPTFRRRRQMRRHGLILRTTAARAASAREGSLFGHCEHPLSAGLRYVMLMFISFICLLLVGWGTRIRT